MKEFNNQFFLGIDWEDFGLLSYDLGNIENPTKYELDFIKENEYLLKLLEIIQIKATFFVNARTAERYPYLLQSILKKGHSIQSHGYKHVARETFSDNEFYFDCLKSKKIIEKIINKPVNGYRSPLLSMSRGKYIESLYILRKAGYTFDSSITHNALKKTAHLFKDNKKQINLPLEVFPLCSFKSKFVSFNVAGGSIWRLIPSIILENILKSKYIPHSSSLYLHPYEFGPPLNINRGISKKSNFLKRMLFYIRWNINKKDLEKTLVKLSKNKNIEFLIMK